MERHKEDILQRTSARSMLRRARTNYHRIKRTDEVEARVGLARVYVTLAERYTGVWKLFFYWYSWCAFTHASKAYVIGLKTADQVEAVSSIFSKTPERFGGNRELAYKMIQDALEGDYGSMKAHTQALLLQGLVRIAESTDSEHICVMNARHRKALALESEILDEADRSYALQQLIKILFDAAVFFWKYREMNDFEHGVQPPEPYIRGMFARALSMAKPTIARDQAIKIRAKLRELGLNPAEILETPKEYRHWIPDQE